MGMADKVLCPVCQHPVRFNSRYPRAVCPDCVKKAADPAGRLVEFFNTSLSGGISGQYQDDGTPYGQTDVYIFGVRCEASEAHLGGVVIQAV